MSRWREPPDPQQIAMRPGKGAGNRGISAAASGADFIWNRIRWLTPPANFRDASGVRDRRNQRLNVRFIPEEFKPRNSVLRCKTCYLVATFDNDYSRLLRFAALLASEFAGGSENRSVEASCEATGKELKPFAFSGRVVRAVKLYLNANAARFTASIAEAIAYEVHTAFAAFVAALMIPRVIGIRRSQDPDEILLERIAARRLRRRALLHSGINVDCGFGRFGGRSKELPTLRSEAPARRFLVVRMNIARFDCDLVDEEAKTRPALFGEGVSLGVESCLKRSIDVAHLGNTAPLCNRSQCDTDLVITAESGVGAFDWFESGHLRNGKTRSSALNASGLGSALVMLVEFIDDIWTVETLFGGCGIIRIQAAYKD